jgi:hypothetical protein
MLIAHGPPDKHTGVEHGAGCHTNGPMPSTHIVGIGKGQSLIDQAVKTWCFDFLVTQGMYGIITLIIGKYEKDIGLDRSLPAARCNEHHH